MTADWSGTAAGLAAALGGGLLIGLERERRKGRGAHRGAAGVRSFALAALGGGIAQVLGHPALVALGAALVAALAAVAYWASRRGHAGAAARTDADPGLTSELALFVTYLVGVLAAQQPLLGAGAAAVVAGLLALRERLHRLATQLLSEAELHDALLLAALALVLLPLLPATPWALLGGVAPRTLLLTVLLILALQAAGHVAGRLLGARTGLALSGLLSGFVSSTATIVAMGAVVRGAGADPGRARAATAGALASTAATWVQVLLLVGALAPAALPGLLAPMAAGAGVAALCAVLCAARVARRGSAGPEGSAAGPRPGATGGPLRLREALAVAALLAAVSALVAWAQRTLGVNGLLASTALAALADAHAPVAALATQQAAGSVSAALLLQGALLAVAGNALTRAGAAWVAGGRAYGLAVSATLVLSVAAAGGMVVLVGP